jgi:homogentisate phytyltransferase/homogentisate geranylgeranyltransferase
VIAGVARAARPAAVPLRRMRHAASVVWRFSRPHTVGGTVLGVAGLYAIAVAELPGLTVAGGLGHLAWTLLAGVCVNVFIVGLNQITDVEIDRVNKPWLPIAAGDLSVAGAWWIVGVAGVVALVLAFTQSWIEIAAVAIALAVGVAYSVPPVRLKRRAALAAAAISGVRALVVNLGVYLHFSRTFGDGPEVAAAVWALVLFVAPFSLAIALLKDVPDIEGDRRFHVATFSVRLGPERVHRIGLAALTLAYLGMVLAGPFALPDADAAVLVAGHLAALAVLWRWALTVDVRDRAAYARFYLRVWALFFAEYVLVPAAVVLART